MERSRWVIIPVRTRFRSIEHVAGAKLENTSLSADVFMKQFIASVLPETIIHLELVTGKGKVTYLNLQKKKKSKRTCKT